MLFRKGIYETSYITLFSKSVIQNSSCEDSVLAGKTLTDGPSVMDNEAVPVTE